jgi:hypothetical protein
MEDEKVVDQFTSEEEINKHNHGCCMGSCDDCPGAVSCTGLFDKK